QPPVPGDCAASQPMPANSQLPAVGTPVPPPTDDSGSSGTTVEAFSGREGPNTGLCGVVAAHWWTTCGAANWDAVKLDVHSMLATAQVSVTRPANPDPPAAPSPPPPPPPEPPTGVSPPRR